MKFNIKTIALLSLGGIVIIALLLVLTNKKTDGPADLSLSPTPTANMDASPTPAVSMGASPTPGIIAKEVQDYNYWFQKLDPKSRVLAVYDECAYLVPSNVAYPNNTEVMLDNTRSEQNHVLKIGPTEYQLAAKEWKLVTLSTSQPRPINLPIFCKGIELGQIELQ